MSGHQRDHPRTQPPLPGAHVREGGTRDERRDGACVAKMQWSAPTGMWRTGTSSRSPWCHWKSRCSVCLLRLDGGEGGSTAKQKVPIVLECPTGALSPDIGEAQGVERAHRQSPKPPSDPFIGRCGANLA